MTIFAFLAHRRRTFDRALLLSYPLLWSTRAPYIVAYNVLTCAVLCAILWFLPVTLDAPWVPSSDQIFYATGLATTLLLLRWSIDTARRWRSPVPVSLTFSGVLPTFTLVSLIVASFLAVPFIAAYAQRDHIARTDSLPISSHNALQSLATVCEDNIADVCRRNVDSDCHTESLWTSISTINRLEVEETWKIHISYDPQYRPLHLEKVIRTLNNYLHDTSLDPHGIYAAQLEDFRRDSTGDSPSLICQEALLQISPLASDILRVHARITALLAEHDSDKPPSHKSINIYGLIAIYLALIVVILPIVSRTAFRTTLWFLAGIWILTLFVDNFNDDWGSHHFAELILTLWLGGAVLALFTYRDISTWRLAAAAALTTLLLTPIIPLLIAWEIFPWDYRPTRVFGGILDILDSILPSKLRFWPAHGGMNHAHSWCFACGWLLTALLLVPYQWLAARATSLPQTNPTDSDFTWRP